MPDNQFGWDDYRAVVAVFDRGLCPQPVEQNCNRLFPQTTARLANGGDRRIIGGSKRNIVKADDRKVFGDAKAVLLGGDNHPDGHAVTGAKDCGWPCLRICQQGLPGGDARFNREIPEIDQIGIYGDSGIKQGAAISGFAVGGQDVSARTGDMGDASVAEIDKMTGGDEGGLVIVDDYGWQRASRNPFADNHHRWRGIGRRIGQRCGQATIEQDHGIGLVAAQIGRIGCLALGIVLRIADQNIVARLAGTFFNPRQDGRKERVSDIGNQQQNHARTVQAQVTGHDIGRIPGRGDGGLDFFARGPGNHIGFVQGPADRGNGYPCMAGNIFNRRDLLVHTSSYSAGISLSSGIREMLLPVILIT